MKPGIKTGFTVTVGVLVALTLWQFVFKKVV